MVMAELSFLTIYYYYYYCVVGVNLYLALCAITVLGERPVTCDVSRNTTITCHATLEDGQESTICLRAWNVVPLDSIDKRNCANGSVSVVIELNGFDTWNLQASISGKSRSLSQLSLREKVVPNPPEIVKLVATGTGRFNISFKMPEFWDLGRRLTQKINYTQTKMPSPGHIQEGAIPMNKEVITLPVTVADIAYSLVCFQMRVRHGDREINWSNYSNMKCQHTLPLAPSAGPRSLSAVCVRCGTSESRCVKAFWKAPEEEYWNGIISHYSLVLDSTDKTKPDKLDWVFVNGNLTEYTFENVPSNLNFTVRLKAWTDGGPSPEVKYQVVNQVWTAPTDTNFVFVIFICTASMAACLLLIPLILSIYSKVQANHLPEPHVLNPSKMPSYRAKQPPREIFDSLNKFPSRADDFSSQEVASLSKFVVLPTERRSRSSGDSGVSSAYGTNVECFDNSLSSNDGVFDAIEETNKTDTCTYTGLPHKDVQIAESAKSHSLEALDSDVVFLQKNRNDCEESGWTDYPGGYHTYSRPSLLRKKVQEEGYVPMKNPHGGLHPGEKPITNPKEDESTDDNEIQIYTFMSNNSTSDNVTGNCFSRCSSSCDINDEHRIIT